MSRELIVIGASWGGLDALRRVLASVPDELDVPIAIAQHRAAGSSERGLESVLQRAIPRPVRDVMSAAENLGQHIASEVG